MLAYCRPAILQLFFESRRQVGEILILYNIIEVTWKLQIHTLHFYVLFYLVNGSYIFILYSMIIFLQSITKYHRFMLMFGSHVDGESHSFKNDLPS